MLQERLAAAEAVVAQLRHAEQVGSDALGASSRLMTVMLEAREAASLGPIFGQDAIDGVSVAISSLAQGMRALREAHAALKTHKIEAGLRLTAVGDDGYTTTGLADAVDLQPDAPVRYLQAVG